MGSKKGQRQDHRSIQNKAIELAVDGNSWADIAQILGVTVQTVWLWRQNPEFQDKLTKLQEAIFNETALNHGLYLRNGMATLNKIAINKNKEFSQDNQLKAAVAMVELTHKNIEAIKVVEQNRRVLDMYKESTIEVPVEKVEE